MILKKIFEQSNFSESFTAEIGPFSKVFYNQEIFQTKMDTIEQPSICSTRKDKKKVKQPEN